MLKQNIIHLLIITAYRYNAIGIFCSDILSEPYKIIITTSNDIFFVRIICSFRLKQTRSDLSMDTRTAHFTLVDTLYVMYVSSGSTIFCGLSTRTWISRRNSSLTWKSLVFDGKDTNWKHFIHYEYHSYLYVFTYYVRYLIIS